MIAPHVWHGGASAWFRYVSRGAIALWIGPGTEGHFANLKITR